MANKYTQDTSAIAIMTPLGKDALLLEAFAGTEGLSELYTYKLELLAEDPTKVKFDKLLGQIVTITVNLPDNKKRYLVGHVRTFTEGEKVEAAKKDASFNRYRAEIVPPFWFLTRNTQSRIFQQLAVSDILKQVLTGFKVTFQLQGTYEKRDYCVQYRESDYAFACRLMEEEGIFYFFKHTDGAVEMVVADQASCHPDMPLFKTAKYLKSGNHRIFEWEKVQEMRSVESTLRDFNFETSDKNYEAKQPVLATVKMGTVDHKLKLTGVGDMKHYDFPGDYAYRFDGVNKSGGVQAAELGKITTDSTRTVKLRMEEDTAHAVRGVGLSDCRNFVTGHVFTLEEHEAGKGDYVLTELRQNGTVKGMYTIGGKVTFDYENRFVCIPKALPFRPERKTPQPLVQGPQSAIVVGSSPTDEIFTDKYGRVKVQFIWDRDCKKDATSSCWVRVATPWAGQNWGMIHIPRVGQEVLVAFEGGNPNLPIIVGSVYNDKNMPPYTLPAEMTKSTLKSRSTLKGTTEHFNELRFEDKKDSEEIYFHAQKDFNRVVENNDTLKVGSAQAADGSQTIEIWKNRTSTIKEGDETHTVEKGKRTETIKMGDESVKVEMGNHSLEVSKGDSSYKVTVGTLSEEAGTKIELKVGASTVTLEPAKITLTTGASTVAMEASKITLTSAEITLTGKVQVTGPLLQVSCPVKFG